MSRGVALLLALLLTLTTGRFSAASSPLISIEIQYDGTAHAWRVANAAAVGLSDPSYVFATAKKAEATLAALDKELHQTCKAQLGINSQIQGNFGWSVPAYSVTKCVPIPPTTTTTTSTSSSTSTTSTTPCTADAYCVAGKWCKKGLPNTCVAQIAGGPCSQLDCVSPAVTCSQCVGGQPCPGVAGACP